MDFFECEAEQTSRLASDDVHEVCNYLDAIEYARGQIKSARGLPLSIRLLNEAHHRLMRGVRGANKQPGRTDPKASSMPKSSGERKHRGVSSPLVYRDVVPDRILDSSR
jgi:hypothetical protein